MVNLTRIVLFSAVFAGVVTFYSLRELHTLTSTDDTTSDTGTFPTHTDWRSIAERAVQHVEHFPRHPFRSGKGEGEGNLGARQRRPSPR